EEHARLGVGEVAGAAFLELRRVGLQDPDERNLALVVGDVLHACAAVFLVDVDNGERGSRRLGKLLLFLGRGRFVSLRGCFGVHSRVLLSTLSRWFATSTGGGAL